MTGKAIKHKLHKDVCFYVTNQDEQQDKFVLKGYWVNLGMEKSWIMTNNTTIEVTKKELPEWLYCLNKDAKCLRHEQWKPING